MKPENQYISSVHKRWKGKPRPYYEKMNNPFRSGTADVWYSGSLGDYWIEYKYLPKIPESTEIKPDLSPRQRDWLNDRRSEGRRVAVILGSPDGAVIYTNGEWMQPLSKAQVVARLHTRQQVADWIRDQVGESKCLCPPSSEE